MVVLGTRRISTKEREVIKEVDQMVSIYTPDIKFLERKQRHHIFVHDDMMKGQRNNDIVADTALNGIYPQCHGYTEEAFFFWKKNLGKLSIPVALDQDVTGYYRGNDIDKSPGKIWGEVYSIRPSAFIRLDIEKENTVQFTRRRVQVKIPYIQSNPIPDVKEKILDVWMYVGNHEYWDDQLAGIHSSQPIEKVHDHRSWLGHHYKYK